MRTLSGMMLAAVMTGVMGCGKSDPPAPEPTVPLADPTPPGPTPPPVPGPTPTLPAATAGWEMDPAKHAIPTSPAGGKLGAAAFAPEVLYQGDTLTFRMLKEGFPERQVTMRFSPAHAKVAGDGLKLTVRPDQPAGPDVPVVSTEYPAAKPGAPTATEHLNGYALTLELGKRTGSVLPGKVYLSLESDDKDFLAGTFAAEWVRPVTELPGSEDVPFVQGKVTVIGPADVQVKVGYAAEPKPGEFAFDVVQRPSVGLGWARSDHAKPRTSLLVGAEAVGQPGRYEHTKLPPGRYLVYAAVADGPAMWKWLTVPADGKLTADFTVDSAKFGKLEVTVPAGTTGKVQLAPAEESEMPLPAGSFFALTFSLGLEMDLKDHAAKFDKLGAGKYEVKAGELSATVEVRVGETAKVDLKKK